MNTRCSFTLYVQIKKDSIPPVKERFRDSDGDSLKSSLCGGGYDSRWAIQ